MINLEAEAIGHCFRLFRILNEKAGRKLSNLDIPRGEPNEGTARDRRAPRLQILMIRMSTGTTSDAAPVVSRVIWRWGKKRTRRGGEASEEPRGRGLVE